MFRVALCFGFMWVAQVQKEQVPAEERVEDETAVETSSVVNVLTIDRVALIQK